jgi:enoyl-CoA hydratase/carnithine racemase
VNALAQQQARRLASKPMSSLLETKRLMKLGTQSEVAQRMGQEALIFGRMLGEPAAREAFTAFMDKRLPDFSKH